MRHPLQPPSPPTIAAASPNAGLRTTPASAMAELIRRARQGVPAGAYHTSTAETLMRRLNAHVLVGKEGGNLVFIEDVTDPDGRMFRMEYRSTPDGRHAYAWCLHNAWGGRGNRNAGVGYAAGHVRNDGFLCLGNGMTDAVATSPFTLEAVVQRARFWCTAFSVYRETGQFPNP